MEDNLHRAIKTIKHESAWRGVWTTVWIPYYNRTLLDPFKSQPFCVFSQSLKNPYFCRVLLVGWFGLWYMVKVWQFRHLVTEPRSINRPVLLIKTVPNHFDHVYSTGAVSIPHRIGPIESWTTQAPSTCLAILVVEQRSSFSRHISYILSAIGLGNTSPFAHGLFSLTRRRGRERRSRSSRYIELTLHVKKRRLCSYGIANSLYSFNHFFPELTSGPSVPPFKNAEIEELEPKRLGSKSSSVE